MIYIFIIILTIFLFFIWIAIHHPLKTKEDFFNNPPKGRIIQCNNFRIHIYEKFNSSSKGNVVLLSDNLICSPFSDMHMLCNTLSKEYNTLIYESPGHGWSSKVYCERTISNMVSELHYSLSRSKIHAPYVLVANTTSILLAIHYAQLYPENVQGIISLEGNSPYFYNIVKDISPFKLNFSSLLRKIGFIRFMTYFNRFNSFFDICNNLSEDDLKLSKLFIASTFHNINVNDEEEKLKENAQVIIDNGFIGNIPITIFISKLSHNKDWDNSLKEFKIFSNNVVIKIVKNCDYHLNNTACKIVNDEISLHYSTNLN